MVHTDARWYETETGRTRSWAWCARAGGIQVDLAPRQTTGLNLQVAVKGIGPRALEIRQANRVLWRGELGEQIQWIGLPAVAVTAGRAQLEFTSPAEPVPESPAGGRALGFAVYGIRID